MPHMRPGRRSRRVTAPMYQLPFSRLPLPLRWPVVVQRGAPGPGDQAGWRGEPGHVRAGLGEYGWDAVVDANTTTRCASRQAIVVTSSRSRDAAA
jgi:hypothetical protein